VSSPYDYYPLYDFDTLTSIVDDLKSQICPTGPPPVPSKNLFDLFYALHFTARHVLFLPRDAMHLRY